MMSSKGFTYTELLISLAIISATILTLSAVWLSSLRQTSETNQMRSAQQILNNIAIELIANHGCWNEAALNQWKQNIAEALPNPSLNIHPHQITLSWVSRQKTLSENLAF